MSATIVHFGSDVCSRLLLLRHAGYQVHDCGEAVPKLNDLLREQSKIDAILFNECRSSIVEALHTSRSLTTAPIVAFEGANFLPHPSDFDLVVARLTPPAEWLNQIEALIQRTQQTIERSKTIRQQSSELQAQSASLRESSATQNDRCTRELEVAKQLTKPPKET